MSDGKPCIFKHMVKLPYMEAGIVIMTDLSVVKKLKKLGILSQRWKGEGGVKPVGIKSQVCPEFFGQLPLPKIQDLNSCKSYNKEQLQVSKD